METDVQVVLRYRDGRTERVSLEPIDVASGVLNVQREGGENAQVPFTLLKAVFFPRVDEVAEPVEAGSMISIEFTDGEVIRGLANYNPERNGFFLYPHDRSKSDRIFVVNSAIVSIEVERL
jgi:hypothetical protein